MKPEMKSIAFKYGSLLFLALFEFYNMCAQVHVSNFNGLSVFQNNDAISKLTGYSDGRNAVDNRYEGVKGSPMLFGEMVTALVKVNFLEKYLSVKSDMDVYTNSLVFSHPGTGKLLSFPANVVDEAVITYKGEVLFFRTTKGLQCDRPFDKIRFCQILYSNGPTIIRIALKDLIKADYQGNYSPNKRYDEFETKYNYYMAGTDKVYHKISPTKKSLTALFPDKKELIEAVNEKSFETRDEMIRYLLKKITSADSARN